jgi:hypothetical protein
MEIQMLFLSSRISRYCARIAKAMPQVQRPEFDLEINGANSFRRDGVETLTVLKKYLMVVNVNEYPLR